jgi:hypothetical protein
MARGLLYQLPEDTSMDKHPGKEHEHEPDVEREDAIRRSLDEQGDEKDTFNPRTGEDPGLLELTEDPRERRLKRNTM